MNMQKRYNTRRQISTTIDKSLMDAMDQLSDKTRINKSKLFDEAIELLLEKHDFKLEEQ